MAGETRFACKNLPCENLLRSHLVSYSCEFSCFSGEIRVFREGKIVEWIQVCRIGTRFEGEFPEDVAGSVAAIGGGESLQSMKALSGHMSWHSEKDRGRMVSVSCTSHHERERKEDELTLCKICSILENWPYVIICKIERNLVIDDKKEGVWRRGVDMSCRLQLSLTHILPN